MSIEEIARLDPLGHYSGLTPKDVRVVIRHMFTHSIGAPGTVDNLIHTERVGIGTVLVLSSIKYRFGTRLTTGTANAMLAMDDLHTVRWLSFDIKVQRKGTIDERSSPASGQETFTASTCVLNHNILGEGDDTPLHVSVRERERLEFMYSVGLLAPVFPDTNKPSVGVELVGRFFPIKLYDKLLRGGER